MDACAGFRVAACAAAWQIADLCYLHGRSPPEDRNWGADAQQIEAMKARLAEAEKKLGNVELVVGQSRSPQETEALLEKAGPEAPVLAINVQNFALTRVVAPILDAGRPLAVFSLPASGHDWMYAPRWRREGHRVTLLASSDYDELERALRLLRVIPMMRQTRILLFPPARGTKPACSPEEVKKRLGADVVAVEQKDLDDDAHGRGRQRPFEPKSKRGPRARKRSSNQRRKTSRKRLASASLWTVSSNKQQADGLAIGTCMGWLAAGFLAWGSRGCATAACRRPAKATWTRC